MRYTTFIAPLSLMALPATAHAADCLPEFVDAAQALTVDGVQIEPGGRATRDFQVRVRNAGDAGSCGATIRVARVGAAPDPDTPPYQLSAAGNPRIEILPGLAMGGTSDSDVVIAGAPVDPQGLAVAFRIDVPTPWGLRAGTYVEQLQLSLIDQKGAVADQSALTITVVIPPAVSLHLIGEVVGAGGAGPAQVDLGNLSNTAETRSGRFDALILSTAPYVVSFGSANRGNLLHEHGREQVPYRLFFDGALVNLAGANEFPYFNSTPMGGDRRSMSIVVPPVVALAGNYSDRVTVTVTAM